MRWHWMGVGVSTTCYEEEKRMEDNVKKTV